MNVGGIASSLEPIEELLLFRVMRGQRVLQDELAAPLKNSRDLLHKEGNVLEVVGGDAADDQVEGIISECQGLRLALISELNYEIITSADRKEGEREKKAYHAGR